MSGCPAPSQQHRLRATPLRVSGRRFVRTLKSHLPSARLRSIVYVYNGLERKSVMPHEPVCICILAGGLAGGFVRCSMDANLPARGARGATLVCPSSILYMGTSENPPSRHFGE